jgi:hypothetical protein
MTYASSVDRAKHPNRRPFRLKISGISGPPGRRGPVRPLSCHRSRLARRGSVDQNEKFEFPAGGFLGCAPRTRRWTGSRHGGQRTAATGYAIALRREKNRARKGAPCPAKPMSCRGPRESEIARCRDACVSRLFACAPVSWHPWSPCAPFASKARHARLLSDQAKTWRRPGATDCVRLGARSDCRHSRHR